MMRRLREWLDAQVGVMLADYFPKPLTVLDRDVSLSVVQATLDYGRTLGLAPLDAAEVLHLEDGVVTVRPQSLRLTVRAAYKLPVAIVRSTFGLRHRPLRWVGADLQTALDEARRLLDTDLDALSERELLTLAQKAITLRTALFVSRRPHFLPSFALKIISEPLSRLLPGLKEAGNLSGMDYPTARFRRDLADLALAQRQTADGNGSDDDFNRTVARFLAAHGGRGQTFLPLVSDPVWDTARDSLLAVLPALAATTARPADDAEPRAKRHGPLTRRLTEIAAERDWMAYGYEQATRVIRNSVQALGDRFARSGHLADPHDVVHLRLDEIEQIVTGGPPPREVIYQRCSAFGLLRRPSVANDPAAVLRGVGASPGTYEGVARVVVAPEAFDTLNPGEILVCEMTSPTWLPLLMVAGAVVADRGGILSHAAIVAREFGIPAVTGTGRATTWMVSGSRYLVDGGKGTVHRLGEATDGVVDADELPDAR